MNNVIFDISNLAHGIFHFIKEDPLEDIPATLQLNLLYDIKKYAEQFKFDRIILVFDDDSWRKNYTNSPDCITKKKYKAHRKSDYTAEDFIKFAKFDETLTNFYTFIKENTKLLCLKRRKLEADDFVWGVCEHFKDDTNYIISTDKDFMQLIRNNVSVYSPVQKKFRSLEEYNNDPELFLFEKCVRGEQKMGDNIQSSYPNLRKEKMFKAYYDVFLRENMMLHSFEVDYYDNDGVLQKITYNTRDVFEENMLLMGLGHQPDYIKTRVFEEINIEAERPKTFQLITFLKFCKKNNLDSIVEKHSTFMHILNNRPIIRS